MSQLTPREEWFRARVGTKVFRNSNGCDCPLCLLTLEKGILVNDFNHANYLYDTETEYTAEGFPLRYFESKEEADQFAKDNPPPVTE